MIVIWCNICNERPAEGKLTVIIEGIEQIIDACTICVNDPTKVEFV